MITAMQTLISQIETEINKGGNGAMATGFDYGLKKAKQLAEQLLEMEKEQIINAHYQGYRPSIGTTEISEKYYNETFKTE
jgi:hypothetical protein